MVKDIRYIGGFLVVLFVVGYFSLLINTDSVGLAQDYVTMGSSTIGEGHVARQISTPRITIEGRILLEGSQNYEGITVELSPSDQSNSTKDLKVTDSAGNYVFQNIDPTQDYNMHATMDGFNDDYLCFYADKLSSITVFHATDLILMLRLPFQRLPQPE